MGARVEMCKSEGMKRRFFILTMAALLLSGCGIRPNSLEPPAGAEGKTYPRTYPDLSNDPAPNESF